MTEHHPDSEAARAEALRRDGLLVGIAICALTSGMHFSPYFDYVYILLLPIARGLMITSPLITLYLASLVTATSALVLAGVPAAIDERLRGVTTSDSRSLSIWLAGSALIALPALLAAGGLGG